MRSLLVCLLLVVATTGAALPPEYYVPVTKDRPVPADFEPHLVEVDVPRRLQVRLHPEAAEALIDLMTHAASEGVYLEVSSAYRSIRQQELVIEKWVALEMEQGRTEEEAHQRVKLYTAVPGYSEHHLGTAVDLNIVGTPTYQRGQGPLFEYLAANAHNFGFVLSFPPGSKKRSGFIFEPWHLRYVGYSSAKFMMQRRYLQGGPTLNELLEQGVLPVR